ncbi:hypothetical protein GCM10009104_29390 [Marinobacterium maritimum]|uniref:DUF6602 domain-containing protein n=1 Tax=Marinobacterium maritimum TaxID=500162 RepID=A0ABN1I982_9GAMM
MREAVEEFGPPKDSPEWLQFFQDLYLAERASWPEIKAVAFDQIEKHEAWLLSECERIKKRLSTFDPGTAGDAGEEAWAKLLREMLPGLRVVTKGVIYGPKAGQRSPQMDIVVLDPACPSSLDAGKEYPLDYVVAAFECKLTLSLANVAEAMATKRTLKQFASAAAHSGATKPIIPYGILALSHRIENKVKRPLNSVRQGLEKTLVLLEHPDEMLDFVVVVGEFCFVARKSVNYRDGESAAHVVGCYEFVDQDPPKTPPGANALGWFVLNMMQRLTLVRRELESSVRFHNVMDDGVDDCSCGKEWPADAVFSAHLLERMSRGIFDPEVLGYENYLD